MSLLSPFLSLTVTELVKTGTKRKNRSELWLNSQNGAHLPAHRGRGCVVPGALSALSFGQTGFSGAWSNGD